jgi:hypothetical protein
VEVLWGKVIVEFLNDKECTTFNGNTIWEFNLFNMVSSEIMDIFESKKGKESFDIFLRAANDKLGITKIIDILDTYSEPEPTAVCEDSGQVNQAGSEHKGLF